MLHKFGPLKSTQATGDCMHITKNMNIHDCKCDISPWILLTVDDDIEEEADALSEFYICHSRSI